MKKLLLTLLAACVFLAVGLIGLVYAIDYAPPPELPLDVACEGQQAALKVGEPVRMVSWNLQFAASRKYNFFYDRGQDVHAEEQVVRDTLDSIAGTLRELNADVSLLQEIDRDSDRTHRIDQLPALTAVTSAPCQVAASYHRSPFVPSPGHQFMGRVDLNLGLISRYPMQSALRTQLPLLDEPKWRQAFNLKRALLSAEVPVEGLSHPLALGVTHLSAFSRGDGTLTRQVQALEAWIDARPEGQPWVLAGDFNLLPPGDDKSRLGIDSEYYSDANNPLDELLSEHRTVLTDQLAESNRTYLAFGEHEPDRKLDYVLVGGPIHVLDAQVVRQAEPQSDHLPIVFTAILGDPPAPTPDVPDVEVEGAPPTEAAR